MQAWTQEEISALYSSSYSHYQTGQYEKAAELFLQLVALRPFVDVHWRGLASSYQMAGKYTQALQAWGQLALMSESDPLPHLHAAECLISNGEKAEALKALACASERLNNVENSDPLRAKIELLRGAL